MSGVNYNEIATNVVTSLTKDVIKTAWEKVKSYFTDIDLKESVEYGLAYEKYIVDTQNKYSKIKTLIYRRDPKNLYSFYENIGLSHNKEIINTDTINNLLDVSNKIIITGSGGTGKSILCKHLFINSIKETSLIPILLELRSINLYDLNDISLYDLVYNYLVDNGFKLDKKYFDYSMEIGAYVIILDGYDEIHREKIGYVSKEIISLCSKFNSNKYIISSRPMDEFISWNDFTELTTLSLTKKQALNLIDKIEFDENIKHLFINELEKSLFDKYISFASNPLLLIIMLLTFDNNASIPDKLNDFYDKAFSTLYNQHDATKEAYVRDIRSGLGCEDFKLIFSHFCFKSYFHDEYEFSESKIHTYIKDAKNKLSVNSFRIEDFHDDLVLSVCMLVRDGLNYCFSHRSFQEYFAAWYTCKLTDDIQKKLLLQRIKDKYYFGDLYFNLLYNMQREKIIKIIYCPILVKIKKEYDKNGFDIQFISLFVDEILLIKIKINKNNSNDIINTYKIMCRIKNILYNNMLDIICDTTNYNLSSMINLNQKFLEQLFNNKNTEEQNNLIKKTYSLVNASEIIGTDNVIAAFQEFHQTILYCFTILDKYSTAPINKNKSISSIIDDL